MCLVYTMRLTDRLTCHAGIQPLGKMESHTGAPSLLVTSKIITSIRHSHYLHHRLINYYTRTILPLPYLHLHKCCYSPSIHKHPCIVTLTFGKSIACVLHLVLYLQDTHSINESGADGRVIQTISIRPSTIFHPPTGGGRFIYGDKHRFHAVAW